MRGRWVAAGTLTMLCAAKVRLVVGGRFELENNSDFLEVQSPNGVVIKRFTGPVALGPADELVGPRVLAALRDGLVGDEIRIHSDRGVGELIGTSCHTAASGCRG
jgi:hypothetical protein